MSEAPVCVASTLSRGRVANLQTARCRHRVISDPLIVCAAISFDVEAATSAASKTPLRECVYP